MNFSAVILAGGKSSRMGRDKAGLEVAGMTLLERQITLAKAAGATEVFVSGRAEQNYARFGCPVLKDNFPNAGPLAGIESALQLCCEPLLLVLAVDMPQLQVSLVEQLKERSEGRHGVIPRLAGHSEPLAALYPKIAGPIATGLLQSASIGSPGAGVFANRCVQVGWAQFYDLPETVAGCFQSWNEPKDVVPL